MYLARKTLQELAEDRGFIIPEEEKEADFTYVPSDYGVRYQQYKPSSRGKTFQQIFEELSQEKRLPKTFLPKLQQIYWNEDMTQSLGIFIHPGKITTEEARFLFLIYEKFDLTQMVLARESDNTHVRDVLLKLNNVTLFTINELLFNPNRHFYTPIYIQPDDDTLKGFLTERFYKTGISQRFSNDIIMRYFGFKGGQILIELYDNLYLPGSLIRGELTWIKVIDV